MNPEPENEHGEGACLDTTDIPSRIELLRTCLTKILDGFGWSIEKKEALIHEMIQLSPAQLESELNEMGIDICALYQSYQVSCEDVINEYQHRVKKLDKALIEVELRNLQGKISDDFLEAKKTQLGAIRKQLDDKFR
nr:hypothetical protein [Candidatus Sigynarchaeota archaeon]